MYRIIFVLCLLLAGLVAFVDPSAPSADAACGGPAGPPCTPTPTSTAAVTATATATATATVTPTRTPTPTPTTIPPTPTPVPPTPTPTPVPPTPREVYDANLKVLLQEYRFEPINRAYPFGTTKNMPRRWASGLVITDPTLGQVTVTTPGIGVGCDIFPSINGDVTLRRSNRNDTHRLVLARSAKVYVLWREPLNLKPTWLDGSYTAGANVGVNHNATPATYYSFVKNVSAGENLFGGPYSAGTTVTGSRNVPWFVFCEANGTPTPAPGVPGEEVPPLQNQKCPAWVHDLFVADGPDGQEYRTWHHQIDPKYWCYFQHEHGTNPSHCRPDWTPLFDYSMNKGGMSEAHPGYKAVVFDGRDPATNNGHRYGLCVLFHQGSTTPNSAACVRFHTFDITVVDRSNGNAVVADFHLVGDTGRNEDNTDPLVGPPNPITPSACPTQWQDAKDDGSQGSRQVPVLPSMTYAPWRWHFSQVIIGLIGSLHVNVQDPLAVCPDTNCNTAHVVPGQSGTQRFTSLKGGFNVDDPGVAIRGTTGNFSSDFYGRTTVANGTPGSIPQFIAPGLDLAGINLPIGGADGNCVDELAWGAINRCFAGAPTGLTAERENSIPDAGLPDMGAN